MDFDNLLCTLEEKDMTGYYDGDTSYPLIISYGKLILAEFDYNEHPAETFPDLIKGESLSPFCTIMVH